MCGIVAQFSKKLKEPDKGRIRDMAEDINHRGPDDEGFYFGEWFGLGFKRLSIIDLSLSGHQPMFDDEKRFMIIYNGELYNFKDIRKELLVSGYSFSSRSDTEVVLKSFIHWGPECLQRFVGMFVFIIVDLLYEKVFVARDHLGIKPLYIYEDNNNILFASEIKCFRHYTTFKVNESALYEQFFYKYVSGRRTIFKDVHRLSPGSYLEFDKDCVISQKKYYDVSNALLNAKNYPINIEEVESELKNSIFSHTQSDVGYNIQLSGGVDSSYITAVLVQDYGQKPSTYSVSITGYERDEGPYQNIISKKYNTEHHSYSFNETDMAENLPKATWHSDMPIIHTNCVFLMLLCKYARERSKVILTGEGADELFGGYHRYDIHSSRRIAFELKRMGFKPAMFPNIWKFRTIRYLLSKDIGLDEQATLLDDNSMKFFKNITKNILYRKEVSGKYPDLLRKIIASDQTNYLASLLERQDKMAMAMSVEARVPFCVPYLFDIVNSFNPKDKIRPVPKSILKKIFEKYLDKDFVYRRKTGFALPVATWLKDKKGLREYLDLLTDSTFRQRGFYNATAVSKAVDAFLKGENNQYPNIGLLWILIRFEIWHRMFIDEPTKQLS